MNRQERRQLKKLMPKHLTDIGDEIIEWTHKYEGIDDDQLEILIANAIKALSYDDLMLLTLYIDEHINKGS